jgi:hypothetical protein
MANNRLYLGDTSNSEYILFSKGFGGGWRGVYNLDAVEKFLRKRIDESDCAGATTLFFFSEGSPVYDVMRLHGTYIK